MRESANTLPPADAEVSLPEAAQRLRLSHQQAYVAVLRGELTARKVGARWFVSVASIDAYARGGNDA